LILILVSKIETTIYYQKIIQADLVETMAA